MVGCQQVLADQGQGMFSLRVLVGVGQDNLAMGGTGQALGYWCTIYFRIMLGLFPESVRST